MPSDIQPNGLLSQLVGIKAQKQAQDKLNAIQTYKSILDPDSSATEGMRQYAGNSMLQLVGQEFGGGKNGGSGGKGNPVVDLFKHVIGKAVNAGGQKQPQQPQQSAGAHGASGAGAVPAPDQRFLTRDQIEERKAATQAKIDAARAKQAQDIETAKNKADTESMAGNATGVRMVRQADLKEAGIAKDDPRYQEYMLYGDKAVQLEKKAQVKPAAGKAVQVIGPDGKQFTGFQRQDTDGSMQLYKLGSTAPLDPTQYAEATKEPQDVTPIRSHEERLKVEHPDWTPEKVKLEAAKAVDKEEADKAKNAQTRLNVYMQSQGGAQTTSDIKPGSEDYKVAEKLANGKMTMTQFRTLFSYSRNPNKREAIFNKASEINPGFDPAKNERDFRFAENVGIRRQVASMNNLTRTRYQGKTSVEALLEASDKASRTFFSTDLNKAILSGGVRIGGKDYSNFRTARVAFADELSLALGVGNATDMAKQMGFDMTDPSLTPKQFSESMRDIVVPFIERRRESLNDQMGVYGDQSGGDQGSSSAGGGGGEDKEYQGHTYHRDKAGDPWKLVK